MRNKIYSPYHPMAITDSAARQRPIWGWFFAVILGLSLAVSLQASQTDDRYYQIYVQIEKADDLAKAGQSDRAIARYQEALTALREIKETYPTYNPKLVSSRLDYLTAQIEVLSNPPPPKDLTGATETDAGNSGAIKTSTTGAVRVKLLEAGAEPRAVLRLQPTLGATQIIKVVVRMKMGLTAADATNEMMSIPPMKLGATLTTKSISAQGEVGFEALVDEAGLLKEGNLPAEAVEAMQKQFEAVKGISIAGTMTDRYYTRKLEAKAPRSANAEMRESIDDIKEAFANKEFILPEEAIGVGATWEVKQKTKNQGINIDQTIKHELISIEGNVLVVKSTTRESAANQKIPNPILPALKVDMTKLTGTGTETATIDLTKVMPVKSTMEDRSEIIMSINTDGKRQTMTMTMETQGTLESE